MSSTAVQKQVGHTIVQLPHERQRLRDVVPARVLEIGEQRLAHVGGVDGAGHPGGCAVDHGPSGLTVGIVGGPQRQLVEELGAALAPGADKEAVLAVEQLRQREIEAVLGAGAGAHRRAEAGGSRVAAVDGHDERAVAAGCVVSVDVRAAREDAVLDADRSEVAGADAEKGERLGRRRLRLDRHAPVPPGAPEAQPRREEELLPGVRTDREAEAGLIVAAVQPVAAALGLVRPADRQVGGRLELRVDDRPVAHARPHHAVAACPQRLHESLESVEPDERIA